jgi:hypothetical protein
MTIPTPKEATYDRLRRYVKEYYEEVWPTLTAKVPSDDDCFDMELRSDGYANAHVEGQHNTEGPKCGLTTATECGERIAASEWVECN